jgi:thiamine-monophosphate kinase
VYVSGRVGDASLALAATAGRTEVDAESLALLARRLDEPQPRVALGVALRGVASSALDISDGLTGDLGHVLKASRVGATLDLAAIPCADALRAKFIGSERELALGLLLAGGDDYELCFTASPAMRERVDAIERALGLPLTPIGSINVDTALVVNDEHGTPLAALPRAFDHFG